MDGNKWEKWLLGLLALLVTATFARVWVDGERHEVAIRLNQQAILTNQATLSRIEKRLETHETAFAHPAALAAIAGLEARINAQHGIPEKERRKPD